MSTPKEDLLAEITRRLRRARVGTMAWSSSFHTAFGVSGLLGLIVSFLSSDGVSETIIGFSEGRLISALSLLAAALTFVGGFGGFERKWKANRVMRSEMEKLLLDVRDPEADSADIRNRLKAAIDRLDGSITGVDKKLS